MNSALYVDVTTYHCIREQLDFDKWLRQNGLEPGDISDLVYLTDFGKMYATVLEYDDRGNHFVMAGTEKNPIPAHSYKEVKVYVTPGRKLLEDIRQAVEVAHGY